MYELAAEFAHQLNSMSSRLNLTSLIAILHAPFLFSVAMGHEAKGVAELGSLDAKGDRAHRFAVWLLSTQHGIAAIYCVFGLLLAWMAALVYFRIVCFIELKSMTIGPRGGRTETGLGFTMLIVICTGWTVWAILKVVRARRHCKLLGA